MVYSRTICNIDGFQAVLRIPIICILLAVVALCVFRIPVIPSGISFFHFVTWFVNLYLDVRELLYYIYEVSNDLLKFNYTQNPINYAILKKNTKECLDKDISLNSRLNFI